MAGSRNHESLYREITDKIVADLQNGITPWVRPWRAGAGGSPLGLPQNALTKCSYSGINILLLWAALDERDFAASKWLTFKQARAIQCCWQNLTVMICRNRVKRFE
jgi:antirestriction protein ArdC